ncbi:TPA: PblA [Streptococcus suis]|nr:PblA [Streptococcus suis]HEM4595980.1 PblA [Streptococcus suis]
MEIFKLFGSIGLKNKEANQAIDETTEKARTAGDKIKDTFGKVATFLGTVFAGKAIFDFGKSVVEAAATAKAVQAQFDQVFEGIRDVAENKLNDLAKTVGAVPSRIKPAFNQIASFAKVAGMDASQSLEFTTRATEAAADSAAFYDKSLEETTETLKSYLKGNFNVADNLGILSTETTRNAKATELFGQKYKDLDGIQQQEVLLRMFEDANKVSGAMGQAARESDGFENVMGNLKQTWEDFKVLVGGPLLQPVVAGLQLATKWIQDLGGKFQEFEPKITLFAEKLKDFTGFLKSNPAVLDGLKSAVVGLTAAWTSYKVITGVLRGIETARNTLLAVGNGLMLARFTQSGALTVAEATQAAATMGATGAFSAFNAVLSLNPIMLVVGAIAALVAGLVWFFTQTETGREMWSNFIEWAQNAWEGIGEFFSNLWQSITEGAINLWNGIVDTWNHAVEIVKNVWSSISEFFTNLWADVQTTAIEAWNTFVQGVMMVVQPFIDTFMQYWTAMSDGLSQMWEGVKMFFQGAWEFIKAIFMGAVLIILDIVTGNFGRLGADLDLIWESIKSAITMVWDGIKTYFSGVIDAIVAFGTTYFENFKNLLSAIWEGVKSAAQGAWDWIKTTVSNLITSLIDWARSTWDGFKNFLSSLWEGIKSTATNAWENLKQGVQNIIDGMVSGAKRAWDNLKQSVSDLVSSVTSIFDNLRNIDLFAAGQAILDGFLGGLKSAWDNVTGFISGIADWIFENKGPIEYDRKLLIPAGNAIMEGLGGGLEDGFDDVQDGVLGMAGKLVQKVSSAAKHFKDTVVPQMGDWSSSLDWYAKGEIISLPSMYDVSSSNLLEHSSDGQSNSLLQKIIELLQALLDKDSDVYLDLEKVGRMTYDEHGRIIERGG